MISIVKTLQRKAFTEQLTGAHGFIVHTPAETQIFSSECGEKMILREIFSLDSTENELFSPRCGTRRSVEGAEPSQKLQIVQQMCRS